MTPSQNQSGVNPPARRRSGREGPRELTAAFRRYVERVQSVENPTARDDLDAALTLADEITGDRRSTAIDASLVREYGASIRQLAKAVRQAGRGAAAHPARPGRTPGGRRAGPPPGAARPRDRPRPPARAPRRRPPRRPHPARPRARGRRAVARAARRRRALEAVSRRSRSSSAPAARSPAR